MNLYEFLDSHGMSTTQRVIKFVKKMSPKTIDSFLGEYKQLHGNSTAVPRKGPGFINAFADSWLNVMSPGLVKQLCLFTDTIYLKDPLIEEYYYWKTIYINPSYVMAYPNEEDRTEVFLNSLTKSLQMLVRLRPLVEMGIVVFLPTQLMAGTKEPGAMYSDAFYGPNKELLPSFPDAVLPPQIQQYVGEHLETSPVKIENDAHVIMCGQKLDPSRVIGVYFPDDKGKIYYLYEIQKMDEAKKSFGMFLDIHGRGEPVDIDTFNNWVEGSRNQYVIERLNILETDIQLASSTYSRFLTSSTTSKDLLNLACYGKLDVDCVHETVNLSLPYFDRVTEKTLAKARRNEVAFEEFRNAFSKALSEIKSEEDINKQKIDQIIGDLVRLPVAKVEAKMKSLKRNLFLDAVMFIGTLTTSVLAKEPLTASAALLLAGKAVSDYKSSKSEEDKIKESMGYFYWTAAKQSRF